jgi:DNA-binding transcriptional LysR family regulator
MNSLQNCLKLGVGYSICPEVVVREQLRDGSLSRINWDAEELKTTVLMIWHVEKWCSPLLKHFMRISKNIISGT